MSLIHVKIDISGIVQGVGFRPFIHKLAMRHGLSGFVKNTTFGVEIELSGIPDAVSDFIRDLKKDSPPLAFIDSINVEVLPFPADFSGFSIIPSSADNDKTALVSPDIAICEDCLAELFDPENRRYRFPFINCTNCGPRFTIIKDVPYDRAETTMSGFSMCELCRDEYSDVENRRYHAQPDCCESCGPALFFCGADGQKIRGDAIKTAKQYLLDHKIIAIKGLGGIHLACLPDRDTALSLRFLKHRDEKPFALMCKDLDTAKKLCIISKDEERLLESPMRPIVLLKKRADSLEHISENGYLGIMLPYTPVHYLIFDGGIIDTLIMTSANIADLPICFKNDDAVRSLAGIADGFLLHDRDIFTRCDDSLVWCFDKKEYPVRRSRGYVPFPVKVSKNVGPILACGAEQKASFALSKGSFVFPSQHIGDLKNAETLKHYEEQILHFEKLFDINPKLIACDLHPDYFSSVYADEKSSELCVPLVKIQHHHAHMASCMADNNLSSPCIGIIWDGAGYGEDGTTWGGEFLVGDLSQFSRMGSIRPIALPGGDLAVKEIYRIGLSLLRDAGISSHDIFDHETRDVIFKMLDSGFNCPRSSSIGRLFDGVCAILSLRETVSYEGQGAIILESIASETDKLYPVSFYAQDGIDIIDFRDMIRGIVSDISHGTENSVISAKFMNTLVESAVHVCASLRKKAGLSDVVLSGGVFQNMYMLKRLIKKLSDIGFSVHHHSRVSTNDEGICLGQVMIANEMGWL